MSLYPGFSLLYIVKMNPTSLTVHFGGARGRKIRQNYLALTAKVDDATVPVIHELAPDSMSYTFRNPAGILFSTQFAQPAISLMNLAETAALKTRSLIPDNTLFAGHSLGEYSALAGCASVFSVEDLMSLTFYRGTVMQNSMKLDSEGRTDFSMMAVNPARIGKAFGEENLLKLVQSISSITRLLLEVVNYNIEGQQYVCAGHVSSTLFLVFSRRKLTGFELKTLWILGQVCDRMVSTRSCDFTEPLSNALDVLTGLSYPIELRRGQATVPLSGVNVPFHSSFLRPGIDMYRKYIADVIKPENIQPEKLVGRYIPNLTGKPFTLEKSYAQEVADMTGSETLRQILAALA